MLKTLLTTLLALSFVTWATPATAYVVQITTSIPVASDTQLEAALNFAIDDILRHAIAFAPTAVTVRDARVVGDRIYILLLIADGDGEETMRQLIDADKTEL